MKRIFCAAVILAALFGTAEARRLHPEEEYQTSWCHSHGGEMEVILANGARVDCVTGSHAVEFDFADKWAESLGQSFCYADGTGLDPGIVLIVEPTVSAEQEQKYRERLNAAIRASGRKVTVWVMRKREG